ncbi:MAG: hypothetical protein ACKOTB_15300 [Planctomycetia bacterium]
MGQGADGSVPAAAAVMRHAAFERTRGLVSPLTSTAPPSKKTAGVVTWQAGVSPAGSHASRAVS